MTHKVIKLVNKVRMECDFVVVVVVVAAIVGAYFSSDKFRRNVQSFIDKLNFEYEKKKIM